MGTMRLVVVLMLAGCPTRPLPAPPPRPPLADGEAAPIRRIEPGVLHGLMIAGALRVEPDAALAAALGDRALLAIVTVCLDADGNATGVLRRPSELPAFDRAALDVVKGWRFRPYVDGGAPAPACSFASFRLGQAVTRGHTAAPDEWNDALPAPEVELPPATYVAQAVPPNEIGRRPTPGVALARVCRLRGTRAVPHLWWLQSSGDPVVDRELFDRRVTMPASERPDGTSVCWVWSQIIRDHARPATEPTRVPSVASEVLDARRETGDKLILPADDLKYAIQRSPVHELTVRLEVCIDETGRPVSVRTIDSSGYTGYDMDLLNGVAAWRYRPFLVDGVPAPVCGNVVFNYRQG